MRLLFVASCGGAVFNTHWLTVEFELHHLYGFLSVCQLKHSKLDRAVSCGRFVRSFDHPGWTGVPITYIQFFFDCRSSSERVVTGVG